MAARKRREDELSAPGTVGRRLQDLRMRLGWSQADVANRAGNFKSAELSRVESNDLGGRSDKWRGGLSRAFGTDRETLANYLDGDISLEDFLHKRRSTSATPPPRSGPRPTTVPPSSVFRAAASLAVVDGADDRAIESVRSELSQMGRASGGQIYQAIISAWIRRLKANLPPADVSREMHEVHEKTKRAMDSLPPPAGERDSVRLRRL